MGESGCLKDGNFQNLQVGGGANLSFGALETEFPKSDWTALTTSATLVANTFNTLDPPTAQTHTLPANAISKKGDFIHIVFIDELANGHTWVLTTNLSETLAVGSTSIILPGVSIQAVPTFSVAANHTLTLTGQTTGVAAIGTTVDCFFNGSNWAVKAVVTRQDATTGAGTAAWS